MLTPFAPESGAFGKFLSNVIVEGIEQKLFIPDVFPQWAFVMEQIFSDLSISRDFSGMIWMAPMARTS